MFAGLGIGMLLVMPHYGPRKPRHRSALGHIVPTSMIGRETNGMMWIPGGMFMMGSNDGKSDEAPIHEATVAPLWMDKTEVTNEQFSKFVEATGYVTLAEQTNAPANWRHPSGPDSSITGNAMHPVVQVAWPDAVAFAKWAGKRLPTEAEWEHAARGGLHQQHYVWGSERPTQKEPRANIASTSTVSVASFPANDFGLTDMAGNVAEWCADSYQAEYYKNAPRLNPKGPDEPQAARVIRGGSFRSPTTGDEDYRPSAMMSAPPETFRSDLGFRCVKEAFN
jgi:sulfatase modifying factor 1